MFCTNQACRRTNHTIIRTHCGHVRTNIDCSGESVSRAPDAHSRTVPVRALQLRQPKNKSATYRSHWVCCVEAL